MNCEGLLCASLTWAVLIPILHQEKPRHSKTCCHGRGLSLDQNWAHCQQTEPKALLIEFQGMTRGSQQEVGFSNCYSSVFLVLSCSFTSAFSSAPFYGKNQNENQNENGGWFLDSSPGTFMKYPKQVYCWALSSCTHCLLLEENLCWFHLHLASRAWFSLTPFTARELFLIYFAKPHQNLSLSV